MGIKDFTDASLNVGGVQMGAKNGIDCAAGSIPDGKWIMRILGVDTSKGSTGTGKEASRVLVAYCKEEDMEQAPAIALVKQNLVGRWIKPCASKKGIDEAIDNATLFSVTLKTDDDEITIGEYKFRPQNATKSTVFEG